MMSQTSGHADFNLPLEAHDPLADIDAVGRSEDILLVLKNGVVAKNRGNFLPAT